MIKFENTEVFNFEGAFRGMRNPKNSWDKSDSVFDFPSCQGCYHEGKETCSLSGCAVLGSNDLDLARRLIKAGSDHRKFLRQIFVSVDITAPLYWWKEFDTYKVGTVANSCSTMHTIHKKEFSRDDFSHELLTDRALEALDDLISVLEFYRGAFIDQKEVAWWNNIIQLLPTSYNQKRTVTLNYENLRNIYGSRRNHKLDEWAVGFMDWIKTLPYAEELIIN